MSSHLYNPRPIDYYFEVDHPVGRVFAVDIACLAAPVAKEVRRVWPEPALESLQGPVLAGA